MAIYQTELDGRSYEVVIDPSKKEAPFCHYCQVYRLRTDGTRGLQLATHHSRAWSAWRAVRDQVLRAEDPSL
jgi:molybdenum cofactor biosynthesis enzyme MoaA